MLFLFWRLAYNIGLGWLLYQQSKKKFITKFFEKINSKHSLYPFMKIVLKIGMEDDYDYDVYIIYNFFIS